MFHQNVSLVQQLQGPCRLQFVAKVCLPAVAQLACEAPIAQANILAEHSTLGTQGILKSISKIRAAGSAGKHMHEAKAARRHWQAGVPSHL